MLLRLLALTVAATFCTAVLFASVATASTDQGSGSDISPIMVQLDLVYGENEEPATIFIPFGKTGTLDTAEYSLAITPRLQDGKHEIGLDIDVSESAAGAGSDSARIRSNYTSVVENGDTLSLNEIGLSVGVQVVSSETLEPVAGMSR